MKYLFIGGPADGQRLEVDSSTEVHLVHDMPTLDMELDTAPLIRDRFARVHQYIKHKLTEGPLATYVFVRDVELGGKGILAMLLDGYSSNPSTDRRPVSVSFPGGMTVADLKKAIATWPEKDAHGDPSEVWVAYDGVSSIATELTVLNGSDILFEHASHE